MRLAPKSTHCQLDSKSYTVQAVFVLVILEDSVLLNILPPAAALRPLKGNALL